MEMQSNFQPRMARLTSATMVRAVMRGPEGILTGVLWPVMRNLTWVPPTSMARIFGSLNLGSLGAGGLDGMGTSSWGQGKLYRGWAGVKRGNFKGERFNTEDTEKGWGTWRLVGGLDT